MRGLGSFLGGIGLVEEVAFSVVTDELASVANERRKKGAAKHY